MVAGAGHAALGRSLRHGSKQAHAHMDPSMIKAAAQLHCFARACEDSEVQQLLAAAEDPLKLVAHADEDGHTALHLAAMATPGEAFVRTASVLIEQKANVDARNLLGETPLILCMRTVTEHADKPRDGLRTLQLLLNSKADPNAADSLSLETPIMEAAARGHIAGCRALLNARADPTLKSSMGMTAMRLARGASAEQVRRLLENTARRILGETPTSRGAVQTAVPVEETGNGKGAGSKGAGKGPSKHPEVACSPHRTVQGDTTVLLHLPELGESVEVRCRGVSASTATVGDVRIAAQCQLGFPSGAKLSLRTAADSGQLLNDDGCALAGMAEMAGILDPASPQLPPKWKKVAIQRFVTKAKEVQQAAIQAGDALRKEAPAPASPRSEVRIECLQRGLAVQWCNDEAILQNLLDTDRKWAQSSSLDLAQECHDNRLFCEGLSKEELIAQLRQVLVWRHMGPAQLLQELHKRQLSVPCRLNRGSSSYVDALVEHSCGRLQPVSISGAGAASAFFKAATFDAPNAAPQVKLPEQMPQRPASPPRVKESNSEDHKPLPRAPLRGPRASLYSHYATLGLSLDADSHELRKAYRTLALQYHPDKNLSNQDTSKFLQISAAYETISEAVKAEGSEWI